MKEKVLVAVPGYHGIQPEAQESYIQMMFRAGRDLPDYDFSIHVVVKSEQFRARNRIVNAAIASRFNYLLMLDDDHIVPHNLLTRLVEQMVEHPEYAVIGGLYYQRGGSYDPVVMRRKFPDVKDDWSFRFIRHDDEILMNPGLYEVDIVGGGCMMFRMSCLEKLMPPYFVPEINAGTDISICSRLKDLGFRIAIDTSIELGHLGEKTIVTSRSIGALGQKMARINRGLHDDVKEYLGLNQEQLEYQMDIANHDLAREEAWIESVGDSDKWDDIKKYYQEHGDWHIVNLLIYNMKYENTKEVALRLLDGKVDAGHRVLDYGPGLGHLTIPFLEHGCNVDVAEVKDAPTLAFIDWRCGKRKLDGLSKRLIDEETTPSSDLDVKYKAAFMISVIDHLPEPYTAVQWITDRMEIGGYFVCDYLHVGSADHNPQHLDKIDPTTFQKWMHSIGWETSAESLHMFIYRGK